MYEEFIEKFRELISLEDVTYLYHVTNMDADKICEQGLFLLENRLSSTTIEIPQEFIDNPVNYCLQENGDNYRKNPSIVLLGIPTENIKFAIEKNYEMPLCWEQDEFPKFIIPSRYIIGYIDTNNFEITINENYELINEHIID